VNDENGKNQKSKDAINTLISLGPVIINKSLIFTTALSSFKLDHGNFMKISPQ
jgi:hypothetical protein